MVHRQCWVGVLIMASDRFIMGQCVGIATCQFFTALLVEGQGYFRESEVLLQHAILVAMLLFSSIMGLVGHASGILSVLLP